MPHIYHEYPQNETTVRQCGCLTRLALGRLARLLSRAHQEDGVGDDEWRPANIPRVNHPFSDLLWES